MMIPNPREAQLDYIITKSVIASFVLVITLSFVGLNYENGMKYAAIKYFPETTSGTINNVESLKNSKWISFIDYEFDRDSETFKGRYKQNKLFDKNEYIVGNSVDIISSKYFPSQSTLIDKLYQHETEYGMVVAGVLVSFIILIFLAWNTSQYYKFKNESKKY